MVAFFRLSLYKFFALFPINRPMNTKLLKLCAVMSTVFFLSISAARSGSSGEAEVRDNVPVPILPNSIYSKLGLKQLGLNEAAYKFAVKGWEKLKAKGEISKDIISICDYTQPSGNKRLYVIDMATQTLLFNTLVAHGKNSGDLYANRFSNKPESLQSSLGFYVTGNTYTGAHGLGLRLKGLEPGFNSLADSRDIVMHGASYVCEEFVHQYGRLGKSFGCPAVPIAMHEQIINTIKEGTCLFVFYPDKKYLSASRLLK